MLIALSGVTCMGKSYMMNRLNKDLKLNRVRTIRTREKRPNEVEGVDGLYLTDEELDKLISENKIAYSFNVFGGRYGYLNEDIFSNDDMIFEMHYTMIDDWRKIVPDIKVIYMIPKNINIPINKVKSRKLSLDKEKERIDDIYNQYNTVMNNEEWKSKFDMIVEYDYDEKSVMKIEDIIKKFVEEK